MGSGSGWDHHRGKYTEGAAVRTALIRAVRCIIQGSSLKMEAAFESEISVKISGSRT